MDNLKSVQEAKKDQTVKLMYANRDVWRGKAKGFRLKAAQHSSGADHHNHRDPTREHLHAHVVLTGPEYFSQYIQSIILMLRCSFFITQELQWVLCFVSLKFVSRSNQSRENFDKCVHSKRNYVDRIAQVIWSWKYLMRIIDEILIILAQFVTLMLSETLEESWRLFPGTFLNWIST